MRAPITIDDLTVDELRAVVRVRAERVWLVAVQELARACGESTRGCVERLAAFEHPSTTDLTASRARRWLATPAADLPEHNRQPDPPGPTFRHRPAVYPRRQDMPRAHPRLDEVERLYNDGLPLQAIADQLGYARVQSLSSPLDTLRRQGRIGRRRG